MSWYLEHRLDWIYEMVRIYGFINRGHIMAKFEVSMPQASTDLAEFQRRYPGVIEYDKSAKCYVRKGGA